MTTTQLFFALVGVFGVFGGLIKIYVDAKIDPIGADVKRLIDYLILHEGKISRLEERMK